VGAAGFAVAAVSLAVAAKARPVAAAAEAGPSRSVGVAFLGAGPRRGALGDSLRAGLELALRDRGGRIVEDGPAASSGAAGLDLHCLSSKLEGRDDEQILRVLAGEGRDLVIAAGARFAPALARVARDFPKVRFALVGAPRLSREVPENAAYLSFDDSEAAFLAGALAARMSGGASKAKLGFVGGADDPGSRAYQAGFQAGAAYALPAFRRQGALLAQFCGSFEGGYSDPAEAIAAAQFKKGAVIVFHAAGAAGQGVYAAARKAGARAMGSGGDAAGGVVAAAAVERGEAASALLLDELFASGTVKSGFRLLGLKEGAVALSLDPGAKDGPAAFAAEIEALRARVASGEIRVPFDEASEAEFLKSLD
jgi:basic membrane protein A